MASTKIEWPDYSWNPVTGCTPVSPGCKNCYAKRMTNRLRGRFGYPKDDPFKVTLREDRLEEPLHWKKPRRVFVCSMGDLFHKDVPDEFIDRILAVIALCPQHTFLGLTKRADRQLRYIADEPVSSVGDAAKDILGEPVTAGDWPLPNLWLGVSVEDPGQYERVYWLKQTPAAVRFLSLEPMLAGMTLTPDTLKHID